MKAVIQSINIGPEEAGGNFNGLTEIRMGRLDGTVILAGANGSGKTRLLHFVRNYASGSFNQSPIAKCIKREGSEAIQVHEVPSQYSVHPASSATRQDQSTAKAGFLTDTTNFGNSLQHSRRAAQAIAEDYVFAEVPRLKVSENEKRARTQRWDTLSGLLVSLLNLPVDIDSEGNITIGGRPVDGAYDFFSLGQKKLFAFAVSLAGTSARGQNQLVIFDEPETSLHPEAAIKMIVQMQAALPDGQLWIATHSVPLIAGLGLQHVWFAENGTVTYGGGRTERVIDSLIGGRDNLFALRETVAEPDKIAMARFSAECLQHPHSVDDARANDPQLLQFGTAVQPRASTSISVLDWGCGRGRLKVWLSRHHPKLDSGISYWGYEPDQEAAQKCVENIERVSGLKEDRIYTDMGHISEVHSQNPFDFVVMANVLHEINPAKWIQTFTDVASFLKPSGRLLILEDAGLPVGELPHLAGFLLVDYQSCAKLFASDEKDILRISSSIENMEGRLSCFSIPRDKVRQINEDTLRACFESLRQRAFSQIESFRAEQLESHAKCDYKAGHKHAIAVMQFANATLALSHMKSRKQADAS